ncbi:hypothetical protein [uncultured Roseovarius sp.]|uniref:hypothetical protein n=1 Tax=uncultured Roseovarius sp. TaxID=293344 RepID=UPI0026066F3A|nr:hypothetical protein [uncultured Roseovarius sp.]
MTVRAKYLLAICLFLATCAKAPEQEPLSAPKSQAAPADQVLERAPVSSAIACPNGDDGIGGTGCPQIE